MFSGIIEKQARVEASESSNGSLLIRLSTGFKDLSLGESIAVNGVCLTVAEFTDSGLATFLLSPETLDRTAFHSGIQAGAWVNLERALRVDARLSGHIVQGHVDGIGTVESITTEGECWRLKFRIPDSLSRYCVEKGSIALHGISLTINQLSTVGESPSWIELMIIPHTWSHTSLSDLRLGDPVNLEVDVLAKYAERLCQTYLKPQT